MLRHGNITRLYHRRRSGRRDERLVSKSTYMYRLPILPFVFYYGVPGATHSVPYYMLVSFACDMAEKLENSLPPSCVASAYFL